MEVKNNKVNLPIQINLNLSPRDTYVRLSGLGGGGGGGIRVELRSVPLSFYILAETLTRSFDQMEEVQTITLTKKIFYIQKNFEILLWV
jgi:hypothetical protein